MTLNQKRSVVLGLVGRGVAAFKSSLISAAAWLGSLTVACRTSDHEIAGSTPGRSTTR